MADTSQFTDFAFIPAEGLRSRSYSPSEPESEDAIRSQIQGVSDQLRDHINHLQAQLDARTPGASGAHCIGSAPIEDVNGTNVADQLGDLKRQLDNVTLGEIPDGGIYAGKLADGAVTANKLADGSVTMEKLVSGAVSSEKIATGAVGNTQLANGCISAEKLADGAGMLTHRVVLTQSGIWTAPATALYRITLFGGGGGGGAGIYIYNSSWISPYQYFAGAGGSAAVPVNGQFMLPAGAQCQVIIAAGGAGRSTSAYTVSNTTPTFTSVDAEEVAGGESAFQYGGATLLETSSANRITGGAYSHSSKKSVSLTTTVYAGASGAGIVPGTTSDSIGSSSVDSSTTLSGAISYGGGNGALYSYAQISAGTPASGENAATYGCGGGGGCMLFGVVETVPAAFVSAGGDGGSGAAIIEWIA